MERDVRFAESEYYHIYNRGVEKRTIFLDAADYSRMELLLYLCNSETPVKIREYDRRGIKRERLWELDIDRPLVGIGAWCLMPNHFHLLLKEIRGGGISRFMLKLSTAYSMYFNVRYERVGPLTQRPFKAEHVHDDRYFQYLFSYIHLNPVKLIPREREWQERGLRDLSGAKRYLRSFAHSSLADYMGGVRAHRRIISPGDFPWKFDSIYGMVEEITDWLGRGQDAGRTS